VLRVGDAELHEGDAIAIDGSTGQVTGDDVPLTEPDALPRASSAPRGSADRPVA
jgi:hypothetical protein